VERTSVTSETLNNIEFIYYARDLTFTRRRNIWYNRHVEQAASEGF